MTIEPLDGPALVRAVSYPMTGTVIDDRELEAVREVLSSNGPLSNGPWRARFEAAFADMVGVRHALSTTSGTVALELALGLLDLRPGDEVITTPQTYHATIQPLLGRLGHEVRVRFADVRPNMANIDPDRVAELITSRTRAIVMVHYGGLPADMDALMRIADEYGLTVVEDAAHALGSRYRGRPPGGIGHVGCFSFHGSKNISTLGEGGMLTTSRDDWADRVRRIRGNCTDMVLTARVRRFGGSTAPAPGALFPEQAYTHDCLTVRRPGTNATLSEAASAVGLVQLGKLPELTERRRLIAGRFLECLAEFEGVRVQTAADGVEHAYHLFTFFVDPSRYDRDELVRCLGTQGVETFLRYFPLHLLPEWRARGHGLGECPVAERSWFAEHMNLPCHPSLTDAQVERLVSALSMALPKARVR